MYSNKLLLCFIFSLLFTGVISQSFPANWSSRKIHALIIGISDYKDIQIPQLKYAAKDAQLFADYLTTTSGGNVPDSQITLLLNEEATLAAIYNAMNQLKKQVASGDLVYIHFSGHGDVETKNDYSQGFLLAYNSPPNNYRNNAIRIEDVNSLANELSIKKDAHVVLITDACHSGKLAGDFFKGKQLAAAHLQKVLNNEVRLTSCQVDEVAAEGPAWGGGRGVFSYYLLKGLYGFSQSNKDEIIKLEELKNYIVLQFKNDEQLKESEHKQNPVVDGNPNFPVSKFDSASMISFKAYLEKWQKNGTGIPMSMKSFGAVRRQPIDHFFLAASERNLASYLDFKGYKNLDPELLPIKIVEDCIAYQEGRKYWDQLFNLDTLVILKKQLTGSAALCKRFNEKLVVLVHNIAQTVINDYLKGDIEEVERRQYYSGGRMEYRAFLPMLTIAIKITAEENELKRILLVNHSYLSGLIARLQMEVNQDTNDFLKEALADQYHSLQLDPYAAYIHNELGNLLIFKKRFDSALYHFNLANVLAPSWSIPWSNKIRYYYIKNNLPEARKAIITADSLQSGLDFVYTNAGLVMEKDNDLLSAEYYYLKSIRLNDRHFLPKERLGYVYVRTGRYYEADDLFSVTLKDKIHYKINSRFFSDGRVTHPGPQFGPEPDVQVTQCLFDKANLSVKAASYLAMVQCIGDTIKSIEEKAGELNKIIIDQPSILLAHHYLGKYCFQMKRWKEAAQYLIAAVQAYKGVPELKKSIFSEVNSGSLSETESCLVSAILLCYYDVLEDRFMLAHIYQKFGELDKAAEQFKIIAGIKEMVNSSVPDEDEYKRRNLLKEVSGIFYLNKLQLKNNAKQLVSKDWQPKSVPSSYRYIGLIMVARMQEEAGKFDDAETSLISSIRDYSPAMQDIFQPLVVESIDFYGRMVNRFPRNSQWYEKGGNYLKKLLDNYFLSKPMNTWPQEYKSLLSSTNSRMNTNKRPYEERILPGSGEKFTIQLLVSDFAKQSLEWLNNAIRFSGDLSPDPPLQRAIAELYSFTGNSQEAITWYGYYLHRMPDSVNVRKTLIRWLIMNNERPRAFQQLQVLQAKNQLSKPLWLLLAKYQMLSGKFVESGNSLAKCRSFGLDKNSVMILYTKWNILRGKLAEGLQLCRDSIVNNRNGLIKDEFDDLMLEKDLDARDYTLARLNMMLDRKKEAILSLKKVFAEKRRIFYLLHVDTMWKSPLSASQPDFTYELRKEVQTVVYTVDWAGIYNDFVNNF